MGGDQETQSNSSTENTIPVWASVAGRDTYKAAKGLANTAYDPARDASVAGLSPYTTGAFSLVKGNTGQAQPLINDAGAAYKYNSGFSAPSVAAGRLSKTDLAPYLNPFTSSVIDATNAVSKNALDKTLVDSGAAATAAHAFGGTRAANADAVLRSQYAIGAGQTAAQLNEENFKQAQSSALSDIGNRLTADEANQSAALSSAGVRNNAAAGLLSSGAALQTANQNDASNLLSIGSLDQTQKQKMLDAATGNADKRYQNLLQGIGLRSSTLGMTPLNTTSNSSGTSNTSTTPDISTAIFGGLKALGGLSGIGGGLTSFGLLK